MAALRETNRLRLACDGCHARKLRCTRNSTACVRCIRNRVPCIYSPARKVGRQSKAEKIALKELEMFSVPTDTELLESICGGQVEQSSPQPSGQESLHPAFWACLSSAQYPHLSLEGVWSVSQSAGDEASARDGDHYDNMTMAIGPDAFLDDEIPIDQSQNIQSAYSESPETFGLKPSKQGTSDTIKSMAVNSSSGEVVEGRDGISTGIIFEKIQRLSELQQDLFTQRARLTDIDAMIGTGRAILELTRSLFTSFTPNPRIEKIMIFGIDGSDDPASMLLALTPSLLVVTTYNDIISLISVALDETDNLGLCVPTDRSEVEAVSGVPGQGSIQRPQSQWSMHNAAGLYEMTLKVGKQDLDFPMRLILLMSVIEYQLGPLYRSIQLIRSESLQAEVLDTSRDMLRTSTDGLWSAIRGLLERIGKLIQHAKTLDIG